MPATVAIDADPETIWPWLVQIGYRRAGWYGYDWIDNDRIPSARVVLTQGLKPGDVVPIWRGIGFPVRAIQTNRYMVFASDDDKNSMALELLPAGAGRTRLVWRIRLAPYNWKSPPVLLQGFTDVADFIAVRQNLLGIKVRAEGKAPESSVWMHVALALWVLSFLLFLTAEIGLVVREDPYGPLIAAMATGLITVFLVLANLALWVDLLGVLVAGLCVRLAFRERSRWRPATAAKASIVAGAPTPK